MPYQIFIRLRTLLDGKKIELIISSTFQFQYVDLKCFLQVYQYTHTH